MRKHRYEYAIIKRQNRLFLSLAYGSLTSLVLLCSPINEEGNSLPKEAITVENAGQICLEMAHLEVKGHFTPQGCFSSSCTQPLEQYIDVRVLLQEKKICFMTHFVLFDPNGPEPHLCTDDCNGAGSFYFDIGNVDSGTYSIWLGESNLGTVIIPFDSVQTQDTCFGTWL